MPNHIHFIIEILEFDFDKDIDNQNNYNITNDKNDGSEEMGRKTLPVRGFFRINARCFRSRLL